MTRPQLEACIYAWREQSRSALPNGEPYPMDKPRAAGLDFLRGYNSGSEKEDRATIKQLESVFTALQGLL